MQTTATRDVRGEILAVITEVAAELDAKLVPLADDVKLSESGLDSLCLATIVARLEDQFGFDPFSQIAFADFPTTVGGLIAAYERRQG